MSGVWVDEWIVPVITDISSRLLCPMAPLYTNYCSPHYNTLWSVMCCLVVCEYPLAYTEIRDCTLLKSPMSSIQYHLHFTANSYPTKVSFIRFCDFEYIENLDFFSGRENISPRIKVTTDYFCLVCEIWSNSRKKSSIWCTETGMYLMGNFYYSVIGPLWLHNDKSVLSRDQ